MARKKKKKRTVNRPDEKLEVPYFQIADVIHELCLLAAKARSHTDSSRTPPTMERIVGGPNCVTNPWDDAVRLARNTSDAKGIPFSVFDPVITEARAILNDLVQVAAGNKHISFSLFDLKCIKIENRLRELGQTYAGAMSNGEKKVEQAPRVELALAIDGNRVLVKGKPIALHMTSNRAADALTFLAAVIAENGNWISSSDIDKQEESKPNKGKAGVRWDRIYQALPPAIKMHIKASPGKGYRTLLA